MLSDKTIRQRLAEGTLVIKPEPHPSAIQPASIDLRLRADLRTMEGFDALDRYEDGTSGHWLEPGEFLLGSTIEWIEVPDDMVVRVEGKSSIGRKGIVVHATAGFVDPGFKGNITLELANLSGHEFLLIPEMFICQISFDLLDQPAERPYGSKGLNSRYQDSQGTVTSRL
jgi:dCTP deaminase